MLFISFYLLISCLLTVYTSFISCLLSFNYNYTLFISYLYSVHQLFILSSSAVYYLFISCLLSFVKCLPDRTNYMISSHIYIPPNLIIKICLMNILFIFSLRIKMQKFISFIGRKAFLLRRFKIQIVIRLS